MSRTLGEQDVTPEHPDRLLRALAPALYFALGVAGIALVPAAPRTPALVDVPAGIVVWGALETLTVIAVFLHGWSQNSFFALLGAYRFVATGLSVMLVSMFVLIAAALPAGSLNVTDIVDSQRALWNVMRQPLGLPLFLLLGLAITLRGPLDHADSDELAGGTSVEDSGATRLAWQTARGTMAVAFSVMAATVFLGGPLGPWLPGPVWLGAKTLALLAVLLLAGAVLARPEPSRALSALWLIVLPLGFAHLAVTGLVTLL